VFSLFWKNVAGEGDEAGGRKEEEGGKREGRRSSRMTFSASLVFKLDGLASTH